MTHVRIQPDDGPVVTLLAGGSTILEDDGPRDVLSVVIDKLRVANRIAPAREISLAITNAEQAVHWLDALESRRTR